MKKIILIFLTIILLIFAGCSQNDFEYKKNSFEVDKQLKSNISENDESELQKNIENKDGQNLSKNEINKNSSTTESTVEKTKQIKPVFLEGVIKDNKVHLSWTEFDIEEKFKVNKIVYSKNKNFNEKHEINLIKDSSITEKIIEDLEYGSYYFMIETVLINESSVNSNTIEIEIKDNRILKGEQLGLKSIDKYMKRFEKVLYYGEEIKEADIETFRVYKGKGVDKNHVYHRDIVLEEIDPYEVEVFGDLDIYVKDKNYVYFTKMLEVKKLTDDVENFKEFEKGSGYALDSKKVYSRGNELKNIDPKTFDLTSSKWNDFFEDKNGYYFNHHGTGEVIKLPVKKKIKVLVDDCALIDDERYFNYGKEVSNPCN